MILIDDRTGSKEFINLFPSVAAHLTRLSYADMSFLGNGPDDQPWSVGVERKTLKDLLNSITTGRLSGHQLIGLLNAYNVVYVVLEGIWRSNPSTGVLEELHGKKWASVSLGPRKFMARQLHGYLNRLSVINGVVVRETQNKRGTAELVTSLYNWWQKPWSKHRSHDIHKHRMQSEGFVQLKHTLLRRFAAELDGVGYELSGRVEKHFDSVWEAVLAEPNEWTKVEGVGKKIAESAYEEIRRRVK